MRDQCCQRNIGRNNGKGVGEVRGHIERTSSTTLRGGREDGEGGEKGGSLRGEVKG